MISMYKDLSDTLREQRYLDAMQSLAGVIKEAMNKRPSPKVGKMARDIREIMLFNNKLKFDNDDLKFADAVRITRMKEMYSYIDYLEKKVKHLEKQI